MRVAARRRAVLGAGGDAEGGVEARFFRQDIAGALVRQRKFFRERERHAQRLARDGAQFARGDVFRERHAHGEGVVLAVDKDLRAQDASLLQRPRERVLARGDRIFLALFEGDVF